MNDPNRVQKWIALVLMVGLSIAILYPPSTTLKGGIDLVGGTSLLFEIDTTGLEDSQKRGLSEKVMNILKERVDPQGQLNLEWRPVGNTRLEIRMPRPPKEAFERRQKWQDAKARLASINIRRRETEQALAAAPPDRDAKLAELVRGVSDRKALLDTLKEAYDANSKARSSNDADAMAAASSAYEEAMSALLDTNLELGRFSDVLMLPDVKRRETELAKFLTERAGYNSEENGQALTSAIEAYDAWAADKADLEDPSDLKRRLRGAGVLEFRILADRDPASPSQTTDPSNPTLRQPITRYAEQLAKYGPRPKAGDSFSWFEIDDVLEFLRLKNLDNFETEKMAPGMPIVEEYAGKYYVLAHNGAEYSMLHGGEGGKQWKLTSAYADRNPMTGQNVVSFALDSRGGRQFGTLTENNINRSLCIMLDNKAMSHANIRERITDRCQISGSFTPERVSDLVRVLDAGSLPARVKETPLAEQTIGPSLGKTNREKGVNAAMTGAVCVAIFVLIYYGLIGGGVANLALALNLLFVLAAMALMQATFTLPGIAGLILTVGMAIDANVLIFERIREERERGIIFKKALNIGYDKAFSTIIDANLTTLLTCIILGFVGSEEVKGFAIVLGIGITTSMFTSLFVTRLIFNSMVSAGWLSGLRNRNWVGKPNIDWVAKRGTFWTFSTVTVGLGIALFAFLSTTNKEAIYDIEFLGGTSVQIDLRPGVEMTDEEVGRAITATAGEDVSAVQWLVHSGEGLARAEALSGDRPGTFRLESKELTGTQLGTLMFGTIEDKLERGGVLSSGHTVTFVAKPGEFTLDTFIAARDRAVRRVAQAADRLRGARVQRVGDVEDAETSGHSYEVVTTETNRALVQAALVATFGDKLSVQRALNFNLVHDDKLLNEDFFVIESDDHYLSDVIGGDANFDVRAFRGGVAIDIVLEDFEAAVPVSELERRLLEVGLQAEFEEFGQRDSAVFPLGAGEVRPDGTTGYKHFVVAAIDESLMYDDDEGQWHDDVARTELNLVKAALGSEKSLSKVVQFAPQIAGQAKNRAIFSIILALGAIVSYLWLRFGTKDYGLAAIVALVHDVSITLGCMALSYYVSDTVFGTALLVDSFKMDLPMVAAIMTVIGYSLNDTIVVFDRIRENKGKVASLSANIINSSINQTLSRTLLTSLTTFLVVFVLYVWGGSGVHGFSFALLIGVVVGTYSSIGIATPLLYKPELLRTVVWVIGAMIMIATVLAEVDNGPTQLLLAAVIAAVAGYQIIKGRSEVSRDRAALSRA